MLVYEGVKSGFINDVDLNLITDKILNRFKEVFREARKPLIKGGFNI